MNYLSIGEQRLSSEPYTTPRAVKVRKKHICASCTQDIDIGSIAVICYTREHSSYGNIWDMVQDKNYLHPDCILDFESDEGIDIVT